MNKKVHARPASANFATLFTKIHAEYLYYYQVICSETSIANWLPITQIYNLRLKKMTLCIVFSQQPQHSGNNHIDPYSKD